MKNDVDTALRQLMGLPLWGADRAADMEMFQFGERLNVTKQGGGLKVVGTWALHIQCAWRIRHGDKIMVASSDCYARADHWMDSAEAWDWDARGANQLHQRMALFLKGNDNSLVVTDLVADAVGGFSLQLAPSFELEVFPDVSAEDCEYWRLFQPAMELPHFVVTSLGLEN